MSNDNLEIHLSLKKCLAEDVAADEEWRLPEITRAGLPKKSFTKQVCRHFHPLVVYADSETMFRQRKAAEQPGDPNWRGYNSQIVGDNANVFSVGCVAVGRNGFVVPSELQLFMDRTSGCMLHFFRHLLKL